jgi:hypothetical protein
VCSHPTTIPGARQVAAPFGTNFNGVNPQYFEYNAEAEFDSWLSVGMTDGGTEVSSIGVNAAAWDEETDLVVTNGAVYWMSPPNATPRREEVGKTHLSGGRLPLGSAGRL